MGRVNVANIKKSWYYLKRNGIKNTCYAILERLGEEKTEYGYREPLPEELDRQRAGMWKEGPLFSIVVPAYRTRPEYLREMLESVLEQTYGRFELILADATEDASVERVVREYADSRIRYLRLTENQGISGNTSRALEQASGEYTGLLDHDDLLTPDALYEMAERIRLGREKGREPFLLFSDEDKCNQDRTCYFDPHYKEDFNLDLLLSNNYICHFMIMESGLLRRLGLRSEFDGAQDFDLALRAAGELMDREDRIVHIPKVLYHWRCHTGSTADNPQSKLYAYNAGLRALQSFSDERRWPAEAVERKHLGFYGLKYRTDLFEARCDVGAEGGRLLYRRRIVGGIYREDGTSLYQGLPSVYSGYLHRAVLQQDACALDIRCIRVRQECRELFRQITGTPYCEEPDGKFFDFHTLPPGTDYRRVSLELGKALRKEGYRLLWNPQKSRKLQRNEL